MRAPQISQSIERRVHQLVYSTKKSKRSKTGPRNTAGIGGMFPLRKRRLIALRFDVAILPATSCFTSRHCDWCDWSTSDGDNIERESGRSTGHRRHRQSSGEILRPAHAVRHLCAPRGRRRRPRATRASDSRATEGQGIQSLTSKQGPLADWGRTRLALNLVGRSSTVFVAAMLFGAVCIAATRAKPLGIATRQASSSEVRAPPARPGGMGDACKASS
jgi:hypothetical protein